MSRIMHRMPTPTRPPTAVLLAASLATAALLGAPLLAPPPLGAQSIAQRVASVNDGEVQLRFASRPGVCGDGHEMVGSEHGSSYVHTGSGDRGEWEARCLPGPVRVVLTVHAHAVERVRVHVGDDDARPGLADLGTVSAPAAVDYLLALVDTAPSERVGDPALLAAVLGDSVVIWPRLVALARNDARPHDLRQTATFWLSRLAAAAANGTRPFVDVDHDRESEAERADLEVRKAAIFALSRQRRDEAVPALVRIARTNRDPELRSNALFWLGQSGDPRAIDLFEEMLRSRAR